MATEREKLHFEAKQDPSALPFSVYAERSSTGYDFIIIGAGSAGCIVAAELAAGAPASSILLIESGPPVASTNQTVWDPRNWVLVSQESDLEWGYRSTPQAGLDNRVIPMGRAKGIGGCAIHNAMVYVRGGRIGFDRWAEEGNIGWDYDSVLPLFEELESRIEINTIPDMKDPFIADLIVSCNNLGLPFVSNYNVNCDEPCVSFMQFAIDSQTRRETTASTFLGTVPSNVKILTNQTVQSVCIDPTTKTATSVIAMDNDSGEMTTYSADREIVLSAGAIGSPHILMLSGVGPFGELSTHGIDIIQDLPGVGQNLQDDLYVTSFFKSKQPMPDQPFGLMGAVIFGQAKGSDPALGTDIECSLASGQMRGLNLPQDDLPSYLIYPNIQLLESRGTVTLTGRNPYWSPSINPNYLSAPGDLGKCVDALELALEIGRSQWMGNWYENTLMPTTTNLEDYVRKTAGTCYHYAGTCKMGPSSDETAVVAPDLKVHGIENLRVIDASIIPTTVSGNTAGATMMIALKGSRMILAEC
ncbi:GMC family oxidoreductase [Labrenzia sp. CE80]|uniref:GMC family oxidoreductase n=1 Tax=Labrenzia sp. CE80 TaxID=1788986 RepID=UPI001389E06C|nr:GMC family oxidoreductase [Labrenzia sp. CE80]